MIFDIAIRIEPSEERALRRLHRELQRARRTHNPGMILLPPDFDPHTMVHRLIAKIKESKKHP